MGHSYKESFLLEAYQNFQHWIYFQDSNKKLFNWSHCWKFWLNERVNTECFNLITSWKMTNSISLMKYKKILLLSFVLGYRRRTNTVELKYQIAYILSLADVSRMDSKILVNKLALCRLFCCAQRLTCFWLSIICSHVAESGVRMPEVYSATNSHRDITERQGAKVARFLSLLCAS